MKISNILLISLATITLVACSGHVKPSQARTVYIAESAYAVALQAEVAYVKLPLCNPSKEIVRFCSKAEIIAKLRQLDDEAFSALKSAQEAVRADPDSAETQATVDHAIDLSNEFKRLTSGEGKII